MVEHRNVANFFAGMDDASIAPRADRASGSRSPACRFDISVLELFWTLARGFKVVLASDETERVAGGGDRAATERRRSTSACSTSRQTTAARGRDKYRLLLEGARFADTHGFSAVWTPERHFHAFGGLYPNPSVDRRRRRGGHRARRDPRRAAACARCTIRSASPRSGRVVDNLSDGRVGVSFAAGWQPNDFVLRPEQLRATHKQRMYRRRSTTSGGSGAARRWSSEGPRRPRRRAHAAAAGARRSCRSGSPRPATRRPSRWRAPRRQRARPTCSARASTRSRAKIAGLPRRLARGRPPGRGPRDADAARLRRRRRGDGARDRRASR